jgi:hypothetical protein
VKTKRTLHTTGLRGRHVGKGEMVDTFRGLMASLVGAFQK